MTGYTIYFDSAWLRHLDLVALSIGFSGSQSP